MGQHAVSEIKKEDREFRGRLEFLLGYTQSTFGRVDVQNTICSDPDTSTHCCESLAPIHEEASSLSGSTTARDAPVGTEEYHAFVVEYAGAGIGLQVFIKNMSWQNLPRKRGLGPVLADVPATPPYPNCCTGC